MTRVEEALRSQRNGWQEIAERVTGISNRDLPHEPPRRVLLFGIGSSHHAARLVGYSLLRDKSRARVPVYACSALEIGFSVLPAKGDWALGFTHRGGTGPTLAAMDLCRRAGAFVVQVSGVGAPVAETADMALNTVPLEKVEPHTAAMTGAVCAATAMLMGAKVIEEWDAVRSIGDPDLEFFQRRAGKGPAVIVGEWEGEWIAREGALKFMEMARIPVRVYGSEEYFHGPQHALGADGKLWHVSMPKDPRNATMKSAHEVRVSGSTPLAWVPALVELQWLALATALNLGVDPDLKA